ncbi:hypothetical protein QE152_g36702 [Popillia japonica]|uniref:Uncharacterized protein n=1 Tax=Popillia japonica TaxID=7064 RepID=A0AAW1ICX1_POPJA
MYTSHRSVGRQKYTLNFGSGKAENGVPLAVHAPLRFAFTFRCFEIAFGQTAAHRRGRKPRRTRCNSNVEITTRTTRTTTEQMKQNNTKNAMQQQR